MASAPANTTRAGSLGDAGAAGREVLRHHLNDRFARRRRTAETDAYTTTYDQALQLMERRDAFDVTKEPARDLDRYGTHDFGRHCLLARRLLESGVTFVKVTHSNYDTHNENFDFHLEQVGEFDQSFSALLDDLAQRGRLEHTLVIVMSEFGRTPRINHLYGRDHWSAAWSVALAGAGIKPGMVLGKTNANGTAVVDGQVNSRAPVPHLLAGGRARPVRHIRGQRPRDPGRRPDRLGHQGTAGMTAAPEKTHVVKEYSHKSPLIACRFDARGRYVFASAEDRTVRRWDLATGKEAALAGHESWVFALASHPDGETIVTGGGDGQLIWWPVDGREARADPPRAGAPRLGASPGDQPRRFDRRLVRQRPDGPPLVVRRRLAFTRAARP